jgi:DNA helicase-2/ATP-dependent DNA helicase PcrA
MIGLQEGIFPGKRCETQAQIEEERRLFYVAMTRCRKRLWMLGVRRDEYGKTESRFIREAGFNSETVGSIF